MRTLSASLVVATALLAACKQEIHKTTPDELIAAIEKAGVKVEKDGSYNNEPNWEMNMKLKLDGQENYSAARFTSPELARDSCQTKKFGFSLDYWCVNTFSDKAAAAPAWEKAKSIVPKK